MSLRNVTERRIPAQAGGAGMFDARLAKQTLEIAQPGNSHDLRRQRNEGADTRGSCLHGTPQDGFFLPGTRTSNVEPESTDVSAERPAVTKAHTTKSLPGPLNLMSSRKAVKGFGSAVLDSYGPLNAIVIVRRA